MKEFYIAGVQHHKSAECINELSVGTTLEMIPEPTNSYDSNAVQLNYLGDTRLTMLGYVPAKFSANISVKIELSPDLECRISELNPTAKPWERIKVQIGLPEEFDALTKEL
jgi:hypothetical protein